MTAAPVDERYDVTEIRATNGSVVRRLLTCRHAEIVPVESIVTGETLARLCRTCDEQLPAL